MEERDSRPNRERKTLRRSQGFTLVEVLVSMMLSGVALGVVARDFSHNAHTRLDMDQVVETQQALMAANTFVSQELRQAGACLPEVGNFVALDGTDGGERDTLTLRIGKVDPSSLVCQRTILVAAASSTASRLVVADASKFRAGSYIYVTRAAGNGDTFKIASIAGNEIAIVGTLGAPFIVGGGVYALEERRYEVQEIRGNPVLMLSVDGSQPQPIVSGIASFDVRYRLDPCLPCLEVALPADDGEWRTVREVEIRFVARSARALAGGEHLVLDSTTTVRPRNLF